MDKIVAYYRVSTPKQGESGLGLEGQVSAVKAFASSNNCTIIKSYQEVETGKRSDRPELARALAHAKRSRATLVIAKMDRLARNVHFLSGLMESGVDFKACDNPHANRLTVHILAAVAENEAIQISERTKAALAAYKARGGLLGANRPAGPDKTGRFKPAGRKLSDADRAKGRRVALEVQDARATAAYADLAPRILHMRAEGLSLRKIAAALDAEGQTPRRAEKWGPMLVSRILWRFRDTAPEAAPTA